MPGYHWTSRPPPKRAHARVDPPPARPNPPGLSTRSADVSCASGEAVCAWRVRDRLSVLEKYSVDSADESNTKKDGLLSPSKIALPGPVHEFGAETRITLQEHKDTLENAINTQTARLAQEFTRRIKEMRAANDHQIRALKREHHAAVSKLSEEISKGTARESRLKAQLASKLQDLVVLSQAYKDLRTQFLARCGDDSDDLELVETGEDLAA